MAYRKEIISEDPIVITIRDDDFTSRDVKLEVGDIYIYDPPNPTIKKDRVNKREESGDFRLYR